MTSAPRCRSRAKSCSLCVFALLLSLTSLCHPQQAQSQGENPHWQKLVRDQTRARQFEAALTTVEARLAQNPADFEAHGWRGRLLAWQGRWPEAESEYRLVLVHAPDDTDVLCGLANILLWQGKTEEALRVADHARNLAPGQPDILSSRARILRALGRPSEARQQYREILALEPTNLEARTGLSALAGESKHEFRVGADASTFNYTDPAYAQGMLFTSRWSDRWSSAAGVYLYQRFGDNATKFAAEGSFHFTKNNWLTAGGGVAHTSGAIPNSEARFEYGHGLKLASSWVKGLELSYQQHWLWYDGAHVLALSLTQLYYLPRDCTWSFTMTGARSGFAGAGVEWVPSGSTRLEFPLHRQLTASFSFANGTENFAHIDQIGRFSARTFGGGLRYRFTARQDLAGYVAVQDRSQGRTQNSYGLSYGIRF